MINPVVALTILSVACWNPCLTMSKGGAHLALSTGAGGSPLLLADLPDSPKGANPHGPNPHGPGVEDEDPHDEKHDPNMPANGAQEKHKAPKDPYGGQFP